MRNCLLVLVLVCLFAGAASAATREPLSLYGAFQWHQWREQYSEQATGNPASLKEEGPLFGVGVTVPVDLLSRPADSGTLMLRGGGELFAGQVRYHGHLQNHDGTLSPHSTDVIYVGLQGSADLGWRFPTRPVGVEPFAGLGLRYWLRSLQGSGGYDEYWLNLGARLGGRLTWQPAAQASLALSGGAMMPFYTTNEADGTTIKPDGTWSGFGELSYTTPRWEHTLYYEGLRYKRSPAVRVSPTLALLQPPSQSDIFGYRLGYRF